MLPAAPQLRAASARACAKVPAMARNAAHFHVVLHGFLATRLRCRSSVVEHSLGKGEVLSSILSGSTSKAV
jgi:hypothetical protein